MNSRKFEEGGRRAREERQERIPFNSAENMDDEFLSRRECSFPCIEKAYPVFGPDLEPSVKQSEWFGCSAIIERICFFRTEVFFVGI